MKALFLATIAATVAHTTPVVAQSNAVSRYIAWEQHLRDRVNAELSYPEAAADASGDVLVGFQVGANDKPMNIVVHRSSGNPILDQAAVRLVSRLSRLGPIPADGGKVNEVILKLSYGDPSVTAAQSIRIARADREEQLANERRNRELVNGETRVAQGH